MTKINTQIKFLISLKIFNQFVAKIKIEFKVHKILLLKVNRFNVSLEFAAISKQKK